MRVAVMGFGSVWRHRAGRMDSHGRFAPAVYYNTTGVLVKGKPRQRPQILGYARFDLVGGFDSNRLSRMIGRVFECAEPSVWLGYNKLLFKRILKKGEYPDYFFLVANSDLGHLAVGKDGWRSTDSWLLSFSEYAERQEALLLMPIGGWIRSTIGKFVLKASEADRLHARLVLTCEP